jgi:hypothetical protein
MHPRLLAFLFAAAASAGFAQSLELSGGGGLTGPDSAIC